jgi:stage V sporulation protein B
LMAANAFFAAASYIIHFGLGRYLGPAAYGVFGLVLTMMTNVNTVLTSGFPQGAAKYIAEDSSRSGSIIRSSNRIQLVFCLLATALYLGLSGVIAGILRDSSLTPYIMVSAIAIPAYAFFSIYNSGYLNGMRKFGQQALSSAVNSAAKVVFVLLLVWFGLGVQGAVLGYALAAVVGFFIAWRQTGPMGGSKESFNWKKLSRFGIPATVFAFAFLSLTSIDLLAVKALGGSEADVGYYTAASTISKVFYMVFAALAATILPSISRATARNDAALTGSYIRQSMRYMLMLLLPGVLLISATSGNLISLVYSSQYIEAAGPLSILVFGLALMSIYFVLANIIMGAGKPLAALWITLPLVGVDIILNILLIPPLGLNGAAWATTITGFMGMSVSMVYVLVRLKALISLPSAVRISLASIAVYLIALQLPSSTGWLPVKYAGLILLYAGILWITKECGREDLSTVKRLLPLEKFKTAIKLKP